MKVMAENGLKLSTNENGGNGGEEMA